MKTQKKTIEFDVRQQELDGYFFEKLGHDVMKDVVATRNSNRKHDLYAKLLDRYTGTPLSGFAPAEAYSDDEANKTLRELFYPDISDDDFVSSNSKRASTARDSLCAKMLRWEKRRIKKGVKTAPKTEKKPDAFAPNTPEEIAEALDIKKDADEFIQSERKAERSSHRRYPLTIEQREKIEEWVKGKDVFLDGPVWLDKARGVPFHDSAVLSAIKNNKPLSIGDKRYIDKAVELIDRFDWNILKDADGFEQLKLTAYYVAKIINSYRIDLDLDRQLRYTYTLSLSTDKQRKDYFHSADRKHWYNWKNPGENNLPDSENPAYAEYIASQAKPDERKEEGKPVSQPPVKHDVKTVLSLMIEEEKREIGRRQEHLSNLETLLEQLQ